MSSLNVVKVTAKHDYTDSVWDIWLEDEKRIQHARVKANGKYEAVLEACYVLGMSQVVAERIAREA